MPLISPARADPEPPWRENPFDASQSPSTTHRSSPPLPHLNILTRGMGGCTVTQKESLAMLSSLLTLLRTSPLGGLALLSLPVPLVTPSDSAPPPISISEEGGGITESTTPFDLSLSPPFPPFLPLNTTKTKITEARTEEMKTPQQYIEDFQRQTQSFFKSRQRSREGAEIAGNILANLLK